MNPRQLTGPCQVAVRGIRLFLLEMNRQRELEEVASQKTSRKGVCRQLPRKELKRPKDVSDVGDSVETPDSDAWGQGHSAPDTRALCRTSNGRNSPSHSRASDD